VHVDADGTMNQPEDEDEEWIVEGAIPLRSLGVEGAGRGASLRVELRRCDTPKGGTARCGEYRGELLVDGEK
jgi:hypothetical protein